MAVRPDQLLTIRDGAVSFQPAEARALELDREFQSAFAATTLPERPDAARANRFLIAARRRRV